MAIVPRPVIDITARNASKVPSWRRDGNLFIVVHYLGVDGQNPDLYCVGAGDCGYGGHYNIFWDGTTYMAANPDNATVWHCGGGRQGYDPGSGTFFGIATNFNAIGIECSVHFDGTWYFTTETQEALVYLVSTLMDKYNIPIDHVIRHWDVTGKHCLPTDITEVLTKDGWKMLKDVAVGETIACYNSDKDSIVWDAVADTVEPYEAEVLINRKVEATADHRMWLRANSQKSKHFKERLWGDALEGHKQYIIKNGAHYNATGLDLSDDELRLLVWIQGDGNYMKRKNHPDQICGLEFHLAKDRKKDRIKELLAELDIPFVEHKCINGTSHIRVNDKQYIDWAEEWLDNKQFTYKLLEMDDEQWKVFYDELLIVDGCTANQVYTSAQRQNLDVVQALAAMHDTRSHIVSMGSTGKRNIRFHKSRYSVGNNKRGEGTTTRVTEVSCVTVPTGYILVRQNDKTFIVGNCPAPYVENTGYRTNWTWDQFKQKLADYRSGKGEDDEVIAEIFKKARVKKQYKTAKARIVNCDSLNVRLAPSADAPKHSYWGKLSKGNEVSELCRWENGWATIYIAAGEGTGTVGYVNAKYLSAKK